MVEQFSSVRILHDEEQSELVLEGVDELGEEGMGNRL